MADIDPRAPAGSPRYRRAMLALFFAATATFVQAYSPQGLLPDIARDFGISESASSLAIGSTTLGLALGMLPWGRLSDRIGRVAALRWAICCAAVVGMIGPFMPSFELFAALRFVEGLLLAGLPAIGVVALAETVTPMALGGAVGGYIAGTTVGGLLGRLIATNAGELWGWHWGIFAVAVVAAIAAVCFVALMPPTAVPPAPSLPLVGATLENLRNPAVMVMVAQAVLLMGGFVAAYNYLAFRLQQEPFGLSLAQVSWLFLAYLAGTFASRAVWGLVPRVPPAGVLLGSIATMLLGLALSLLPSLALIVVGLVVFTTGFFGAHSIALGLVSRRAHPGSRSLAPSLYYLGYYGGSTLIGWAGGLAFASGGWAGTAAMIAAVLILAASLAWLHAVRRGGLGLVDSQPEP